MELFGLLEMIPAYFGDAQIRPNSLKQSTRQNKNVEYNPKNVTDCFRIFRLHSINNLEMIKGEKLSIES